MSLRIGGYAGVVGGLLWLIAMGGSAIARAEGGPWALLILGATIALLVALVGLSAFQARRYPRLVWAAFVIPASGACVALAGLAAMATVGDRPLVGEYTPWAIWAFGTIALFVGSALFGAATWRTRTLSTGASALLVIGGLLLVPIVGGLAGGFVPDTVGTVVAAIPLVAFSAGWVALGVSALRSDQALPGPVQRAAS